MSADYRSTVSLPHTGFAMRAGLSQREPEILARWDALNLYRRLRESAAGREKFILHDGPPYANGHLHIGHGLNKILKDVINQAEQMRGRDSNYVPGWDCHGLPIEWKVEERYRAAGRDKDEVDIVEFRRECREFAEHWIEIQREEFKRLGIIGDWDHPYTTMSFEAEAQIVRELGKFLLNGGLYKGAKPVMWSPVEKTALAEAEVEYHDVTSPAIFVRFPVTEVGMPAIAGADIVIWTTTPWTMPGNRAIAYGEDVEYAVYEVVEAQDGAQAKPGDRIVLATALESAVAEKAKLYLQRKDVFAGHALAGTRARHPLAGDHYTFDVPLLPADFVAIDQGSGFVHIAPGHGADDYELGRVHDIPAPSTVDDDGCFLDSVPLFAGKHVYKVNPEIIATLADYGTLLGVESYLHSYPHSWRSKKPVIFRNTPQWFISMETNNLREVALAAIDETHWVPAIGQNRIRAMIETRPDWCVSRQREWGVPITVFVHKETGEPLRDGEVIKRVAAAVEEAGADVWFTADPAQFLGPDRDPADYEMVNDILDVWFDSGSTHSFVLDCDETQRWPADLYLEGSDQHRGWFHSSLLESCGTRGRAPYNAVLTHGFVLDADGRKMSKSLGNVVAPQQLIADNGADILRLWSVLSVYTDDLRIGPEIIKGLVDSYRRLRNTLRYLLGNLAGFEESERAAPADMPELERWVLHRLVELDALRVEAFKDYEFHRFYAALHTFCGNELSAFYFDVRKDSLYCDGIGNVRRRAARTVLDIVFEHLVTWLAPACAFTAEEAWLSRYPSDDDSVHLRTFPETPEAWRDDALAERWRRLRAIRRVVTGALEVERREKRIGSSLQAHPVVHVGEVDAVLLADVDLAELAITSQITVTTDAAPADVFTMAEEPGIAVVVGAADGDKCERCWRQLHEVSFETGLCGRCDAVVAVAA